MQWYDNLRISVVTFRELTIAGLRNSRFLLQKFTITRFPIFHELKISQFYVDFSTLRRGNVKMANSRS